jgi:DNA gyrase subunit A
VNKSTLVEGIADLVINRKLPPLLDVRDVSTDDVRIALEIKADADEQKVIAYLFKHTALQTNFQVNLTCLVPTDNPQVSRPERSELREILWNFLLFRLGVVTRRLQHELTALLKRMHLLEGLEAVFDVLDQIIVIIRKSEGKADAAATIMKKFSLDAEQTDAILELKLYRLAKLEILLIRKELEEKRARARQIKSQLKDEGARWGIVRAELQEVMSQYGKDDKRRSVIESAAEEPGFTADDFIVAEDNVVIVSRDGWVKRQKEVRDLSSTRMREGDVVLTAEAGSTRATMVFFSNLGVAYTARIADIPATTGYGEPVQKLFKLGDGEKIVAAYSLDPRVTCGLTVDPPDQPPPTHALAVTSDGYSVRFGLAGFVESSTRSGRKCVRLAEQAEVIGVAILRGGEVLIAATCQGRAMLCKAEEVNFLSGAGRGVILIKLGDDDRVLGFIASKGDRDLLTVETSRGGNQTISTAKYEVTSRGGRGREIIKRGELTRIVPEEPAIPGLPAEA